MSQCKKIYVSMLYMNVNFSEKELELPREKTNLNGGAIAVGIKYKYNSAKEKVSNNGADLINAFIT